MIRLRSATVLAIVGGWAGVIELSVELEGSTQRALAYPDLVGAPEVGDEVLLNTTAVHLALGTGGYHLVVSCPGRAPSDISGPGHLVKARYTPLQAAVLGVDEPDSPHRAVMELVDGLDGMPVVVADLHSALPAILAAIRLDRPAARVAYVMTDGGALPIWFSKTVAQLSGLEWLAGTVTCGQSFGGDLEAVTLHSGLLAARAVLDADIAIVTQGPGNLGVGTPWGFSGVAAGDAINAVVALDGRAIASLRISEADPRERHRGVSHHSRTAVGRVALARCDVVVPLGLSRELEDSVRKDLAGSGIADKHAVIEVDTSGLAEVLIDSPVPMSTMGRSYAEDSAYFLAAAAAGRHAAALLT